MFAIIKVDTADVHVMWVAFEEADVDDSGELTIGEMAALRLYTGPLFAALNGALRNRAGEVEALTQWLEEEKKAEHLRKPGHKSGPENRPKVELHQWATTICMTQAGRLKGAPRLR